MSSPVQTRDVVAGTMTQGRAPTASRRRPAADGLLPALVLAGLVVAWELFVRLAGILPEILAPPSAVVARLVTSSDLYAANLGATLSQVLLGAATGVAVGICGGLLIYYSRVLRQLLYPIVIVSQTIPYYALAPLLILWLGFGLEPKVILIALWVFFPVTINLVAGLGSADPGMIDLMRTFRASRFKVFRMVELPAALPFLFTALQIAVTYSVIASVFVEWIGSRQGLGRLMIVGRTYRQTDLTIGAIVLVSLVAVSLFLLVRVAARAFMPWQHVARHR
jgi:ABC-type nitrate/sulfonate/bicarbonate transport system permease component